MSLVPVLLAVAAGLAGVLLLHAAWSRGGSPGLTIAGWTTLGLSAFAWRAADMGWDMALAYAALNFSLAGLARLAFGLDVRPRRRAASGRVAAGEPPQPTRIGGAIWRAVLVGPLAGAAALGAAVLIAIRAPWGQADRLVAAGFLLPLLWAAGGVWAISDPRSTRATGGLALLAVATFAGAWL